MKKSKILMFFCLIFCFNSYSAEFSDQFELVDFDQSMNIGELDIGQPYEYFKDLYNRNNPKVLFPHTQNFIPKIIHQIWIDDKPMPEVFIEYSAEWKKIFPGWEYKLWRMEDVKKLNFDTKDIFEAISSRQDKINILKFEILNKFGGLYASPDYKPIKNFAPFHNIYKYYGGINPLPINQKNAKTPATGLEFAVAIIGAEPDNLILKRTLTKIRREWIKRGNKNVTVKDTEFDNAIKERSQFTIELYNKAILEIVPYVNRVIMFPPTYLSIVINDKKTDPIIKCLMASDEGFGYHNSLHKETLAVRKRSLASLNLKYPILASTYCYTKRAIQNFGHKIGIFKHSFDY